MRSKLDIVRYWTSEQFIGWDMLADAFPDVDTANAARLRVKRRLKRLDLCITDWRTATPQQRALWMGKLEVLYGEADAAPQHEAAYDGLKGIHAEAIGPSRQALQTIWDEQHDRLEALRARWKREKDWVTFAFFTDIHLPYHDPAAVKLAFQIGADLKPDVVSDGSDIFDFPAISRFGDDRRPFEQIWDADIGNAINAYHHVAGMRKAMMPDAAAIWLWGNHDIRVVRYAHENSGPLSDYGLHSLYKDLLKSGSIIPDYKQPEVDLSPGYIWDHGWKATKRASTTAKGTMERYAFQRSITVGHIHRFGSFVQRGYDYDVSGHTSGCLCQLQAHYDTRRSTWQQGIVVGAFEPDGRRVVQQPIPFMRNGTMLEAWYGGTLYRVPCDE